MIKTTDLMLGNYVVCRVGGKDSDKRSIPINVVALFDDCAYLDFDGNDGDVWEECDKDLFGIPLSRDVFENAGFKFFQVGECCMMGVIDGCDIKVYTNIPFTSFYVFKTEIHYIHQLQNAYHLLTGKDLEVKL